MSGKRINCTGKMSAKRHGDVFSMNMLSSEETTAAELLNTFAKFQGLKDLEIKSGQGIGVVVSLINYDGSDVYFRNAE